MKQSEQFTAKAKSAIERARVAAMEFGGSSVGTAHLLLGVAGEQESMGAKVYVDGAARLLDNREYQDTRRARELLDYMSDPERLREIIGAEEGGAINIRIGPETGVPEMADCSIVTATYTTGNGQQGTIGVIGPTRMHYSRVLSIMNTMGRQLSELFGTGEDEPLKLE